jgi:crossover junction endodeoxyribonuclease RusA
MRIDVTVQGRPAPQGSLRSFANKNTGGIVTPQQPKVLKWRGDVRQAVEGHYPDIDPIEGGFLVDLGFFFRRPKAHTNSKGIVKPSAPIWHVQSPDTDKLVRSVLDALTGVVWHDDKQVAIVHAAKYWSGHDHCTIHIEALEDTDELPDRG